MNNEQMKAATRCEHILMPGDARSIMAITTTVIECMFCERDRLRNERDEARDAERLAMDLWKTAAARLEAVEGELAEAYRALNLRTGLRNWENAIRSRVANAVTEVHCGRCGGSGTGPRERWDFADESRDCQMCGGKGLVMESTKPTAVDALDAGEVGK